MANLQIHLNDHRTAFKREFRDDIYNTIQNTLIHSELHSFTMYLFDGNGSTVHAGTERDLTVLAHHPVMSVWNGVKETQIKVNDVLVAQYFVAENFRHQPHQQLVIFNNLFEDFTGSNKELFTEIIKQVDYIFYTKHLFYSWKHTTDKNALTKQFQEQVKQQQQRFLEEDKSQLQNAEYRLREYMNHIKQYSDKRIRLQAQIEAHETRIDKVAERVLVDLENIANHPKVKDLFIKDGKFEIKTEPIYAYHDVSGDRYYIGNMTIKLDPNNTEVRFFGDNPRKSYWSTSDPHPHVNGRSGEACLGNISGTIAELCSQMELYALTLVCIDFLESVNTSDTAGKNIVNWDRVDEDGNIIQREVEKWTCDVCENEHEVGYGGRILVYDNADEDDYWESRYVCEDCLNHHYQWSEHHGEYIDNESSYWDMEIEE